MPDPLLDESARSRAGRIDWLDTAKGLGMVLLVILHVKADSSAPDSATIVWALKLFRMPMLFVISGILFSPKDLGRLAQSKFRSLIVPYFAYLVVIECLILVKYWATNDSSWYLTEDGIDDLFLGGERLKGVFGVFWFVTCLYISQLTYNVILIRYVNLFSWRLIAVLISILASGYFLSWIAPDYSTPLALGVVPFALPLMWFGSVLRSDLLSRRLMFALSLLVIVTSFVAGHFGENFNMDMKAAEAGVPALSLLLAMALTWAFLEACKFLCFVPGVALISAEISAASMTIMFMHQFIHFTARGVGVKSDIVIILACLSSCYFGWLLIRRSTWLSAVFLGEAKGSHKKPSMLIATEK